MAEPSSSINFIHLFNGYVTVAPEIDRTFAKVIGVEISNRVDLYRRAASPSPAIPSTPATARPVSRTAPPELATDAALLAELATRLALLAALMLAELKLL